MTKAVRECSNFKRVARPEGLKNRVTVFSYYVNFAGAEPIPGPAARLQPIF